MLGMDVGMDVVLSLGCLLVYVCVCVVVECLLYCWLLMNGKEQHLSGSQLSYIDYIRTQASILLTVFSAAHYDHETGSTITL